MLKGCIKGFGWMKSAVVGKSNSISRNNINVSLDKKVTCYDRQFLVSKVINSNTSFTPSPIIIENPTTNYGHLFSPNSLFDIQHFSMTKFITPSHINLLHHQMKSKLDGKIRFGFSSKKTSKTTIEQLSKQIDESEKKQYYEIVKLMNSRKVKQLNLKKFELLRNLVSQNLNLKDNILDFTDLAIFCSILQKKSKLMDKSKIQQEDINCFLQKQLDNYLEGKKNVYLSGELGSNLKKDSWQFAICKDYKLKLFANYNGQQLLHLFYKVKENGEMRYIVRRNDNTKDNELTKQ